MAINYTLNGTEYSTSAGSAPAGANIISSSGAQKAAGVVPTAQPSPAPSAAPINTAQPSPQTATIQPPNAPATPTSGSIPLGQMTAAQAAASGQTAAYNNLVAGVAKGTQAEGAVNSLKDKYTAGLSNVTGTPPDSTGAASAKVAGAVPAMTPPPPDRTQADAVLADDKAHTQYLSDFQASQSTANQGESLTQQYTDLSNQLGLPALNTQLMNMNNVINGTEQDIRDEVTKTGGFATNSQVLALASARNKSLIQNYNDLVQTRTDLTNNLNTMIGLAEKDRTYAQQQINDKLQFDQKQIEFADKAVTNAQSALTSMKASEGWDGIYKAALASGDPQAIDRINSTMGPGFNLETMAQQDAQARATAAQDTALKQAQLQATLQNTKATTAKTGAEIQKLNQDNAGSNGAPIPAKAGQPGYSSTGVKYTVQSATQAITNDWVQKNAQGADGYVSPQTYNSALAEWVGNGFSPADFKAEFGGYVNPNDKTKINN